MNLDPIKLSSIDEYLATLETTENISIVAAWVVGSHAQGLAGPNSDIDISFIFVPPLFGSTHLQCKRDELDSGVKYAAQLPKEDIEFSGTDIRRFVELLDTNDPNTIETLTSPYTLRTHSEIANIKTHVTNNFHPIELFNHYQSFAKNNYLKYIEENDDPTEKRYLHIIRASLNAEYIRETHSYPNQNFPEFITKIPQQLRETWNTELIKKLVTAKKTGNTLTNRFPELDTRIQQTISYELDYQDHIPETTIETEFLQKSMAAVYRDNTSQK